MTSQQVIQLLGAPSNVKLDYTEGGSTVAVHAYHYLDGRYYLAFINNRLIAWGTYPSVMVMLQQHLDRMRGGKHDR